jgi:hypothetical protein
LTGLFKWSARRTEAPAAAPAPVPLPGETVTTSKVFPRFLSALSREPAPVLVDLGPIVGSNIAFFGDRLACKIYVEDLASDVEAFARRGERERLGAFFSVRLSQADESVDGVLCWDLFDHLDRASGRALAGRLTRLLRKGGSLYGFFGTTAVDLSTYSRFAVEAENTLRVRTYPATPVRRTVIVTRDIIKMFDGLNVAESVLLKSSTRETLFRKP